MSDPEKIVQEEFDSAEEVLISRLQEYNSRLDLRSGTTLRSLLIRPAAELYAFVKRSILSLLDRISLTPSNDNIDDILPNFGVTRRIGERASGLVKVVVEERRRYTIPASTEFTAPTGTVRVTRGYKASPDPLDGELPIREGDGAYYFILPVVSGTPGRAGNLERGTQLQASTYISNLLTATVYSDFSGGIDEETAAEAVARIPTTLSHRSLTSRNAITSALRHEFGDRGLQILDIGVQGFGDPAQPRDKDNIFGLATGGTLDIYPRTFSAPHVVSFVTKATRDYNGNYIIHVTKDDAPGAYAVKGVYDVSSTAIGGYTVTEKRSSTVTGHRIDPSSPSTYMFSMYQGIELEAIGVPSHEPEIELLVEMYTAPGVDLIQDYVDAYDSRNLGVDTLVRSPLMVVVSIAADVYRATGDRVDTAAIRDALQEYINSLSFVPYISRSAIVDIMMGHGVRKVDLNTGLQLSGRVYGADGKWHTMSGDNLDLRIFNPSNTLIHEDTTVFVTHPRNIILRERFE